MGAVEDPSRTILRLYPQRPGPSTATAVSPLVPVLCNDLRAADIPEADLVSDVRSLVHSPYWITVTRGLRGKEAGELIDFIDRVSVRRQH